jgi:hypothetical protein
LNVTNIIKKCLLLLINKALKYWPLGLTPTEAPPKGNADTPFEKGSAAAEKTEISAKGNTDETLKSVDDKSAKNPRVDDTNTPSTDACDTADMGASNMAGNTFVEETVKIPVEKKNVVPDVETSLGQQAVEHDVETSLYQQEVMVENYTANVEPNDEAHVEEDQSKSDESGDTGNEEENNVVDLDVEDSLETPLSKTYGPSIAKRLRSSTGKPVPTSTKTPKSRIKSVAVGPKRGWSKVTPKVTTEKKSKKRKVVESSDSEYEDVEEDVPHIHVSVSRKSAGKKTSAVSVMYQLTTSHSIILSMHRDGSMCSRGDLLWKGN